MEVDPSAYFSVLFQPDFVIDDQANNRTLNYTFYGEDPLYECYGAWVDVNITLP